MRRYACFFAMATLVSLINPTLALAEWQAMGPDGGNLQDLWFDPFDDQRMIAASALNGLFESTDGGASYQRMPGSPTHPDFPQSVARPTKIISAPDSPHTLFMATGALGGPSGMFRSDDGGNNWQAINDGLVMDGSYPIGHDLVAALDGAAIYVATDEGAYISFDGTSWTKLALPERIDLIATSASEVNRLYAASGLDGLFRTDDGGVNWNPISNGLGVSFRRAFAVDSDFGERLFQSSDFGQIDISDDLGENWTPAVTGLVDAAGLALFFSIYAQPNSDLVFALSERGGLFRSSDNGSTWALLSIPTQVNALERLTADHDGTLYLLSTSGLYVSHDHGDSWTTRHHGIRAHQFDQMEISAADGSWFVQAGTLYRSSDQGASWVDIGPQSQQADYIAAVSLSSSHPGSIYAANRFNPLATTDAGQNWTDLPIPALGQTTLRGWTDPTDDQTVIMGEFGSGTFSLTFAGLYRSTDGGLSWTRTFEAPLDRLNFQPHSVANDPTTPGTVYFGVHSRTELAFNDGLVLKSTDHGASFEIVFDGMAFTQVIVDAGGNVYAAGSRLSKNNGVWRSTDGGQNWQQYSNGLPNAMNTFDLAAHPTRTGHIFATDGTNIYESVNGGGAWYALEDIGPTNVTNSLAVIPDPVHDYALISGSRGNIFIGRGVTPDDPLAIPTSSRTSLFLLALALALIAIYTQARRSRQRR